MKFSTPLSKSLMVALAFCTLNPIEIIAVDGLGTNGSSDSSANIVVCQRKLGALLVPEEKDTRLVEFKAHENHRDLAIQDDASLPASCDFSTEFPPVYDQKDIGSCTANAGCAALEYHLMKKRGDQFVPQSRQFLYYVERQISQNIHDQQQTTQDCGAQMFEVPMALHRYGSCPELMWPYEPTSNYAQKPTDACFEMAKTMLAGQKVVHSFVLRDLTVIKKLLSHGMPIVFGISVYGSFMNPVNGMIPIPQNNEEKIGGHALVLAGYNDETQCFIVRNSWGENWGVSGHCYIPYEYIMTPELAQGRYAIQLEDVTVQDAADQRGFVTRLLAPAWAVGSAVSSTISSTVGSAVSSTISSTVGAVRSYIPFVS